MAPKGPCGDGYLCGSAGGETQIKQAMDNGRLYPWRLILDARLTLARIALKAGDLTLAPRRVGSRLTYGGSRYPRQAEVNELLKKLRKSAN